MSLRTEAMPDDPNMIAVFLRADRPRRDLGKEGFTPDTRCGPSAPPPLGRVPSVAVPSFVGSPREVLAKIKPAAGKPLYFQTAGPVLVVRVAQAGPHAP